jgi:uncharacterized protein (TIGR02266 family)
MSNSDDNQRKQPRLPIRLIVEYDDADDFIRDYTENLSSGGTFIHTTRVFELDTGIHLILSFPGLLQPIKLAGIVRWSRGGNQPGIGIEFCSSHDREKLDALVALIENRDPHAVTRVIRVLVAEGNPHVADLICTGLGASVRRTYGDAVAFYFATTQNGATAIEMLRTSTFDIAIIDLYLPVVAGAKVIDLARSDLGLVDLPIIATCTDEARTSALASGANLFLGKPMRLREVLASMEPFMALG